jgi:hypothetical protein
MSRIVNGDGQRMSKTAQPDPFDYETLLTIDKRIDMRWHGGRTARLNLRVDLPHGVGQPLLAPVRVGRGNRHGRKAPSATMDAALILVRLYRLSRATRWGHN